jgi:hypothetical protein
MRAEVENKYRLYKTEDHGDMDLLVTGDYWELRRRWFIERNKLGYCEGLLLTDHLGRTLHSCTRSFDGQGFVTVIL